MLRVAAFLTLTVLMHTAVHATPDPNEAIVYEVKRGDTLIDLSKKYFVRPGDYRSVQRANAIANPNIIPLGKKLLIHRDLLRYEPVTARMLSIRGNVNVTAQGRALTASNGMAVGEGALIRTAGASFTTLQLDDGSRISLPSNSEIRIARLRKYALGPSLDYDFDVIRGGMRSKVAPKSSANDRYRVRTPKAVSAVRGTDFQSRIDDKSGADFAEVVEGGLAVGVTGKDAQPLDKGLGLSVNTTGNVITEALLSAPEIEGAGKIQMNPDINFAFNTANIAAMRITLASDAGFTDAFADTIATDGKAQFAGITDGNYFVRFKAISNNGFEGFPRTYAFKRRLNSVSASAGKADLGYAFKWNGDGNGAFQYHFQLYRSDTNSTPIVDEAGLTQKQIILSDLLPGDYFWRVASIQYLDGEAAENWTEFEKLTVSAP
jgi:hypothetical protein